MGRQKEINIHLPPRMLFRHGSYYRVAWVDGKQRWHRLGQDRSIAIDNYYDLEEVPQDSRDMITEQEWPVPDQCRIGLRNKHVTTGELDGWALLMFYRTRNRALFLGREFSISPEDLIGLIQRAAGKCQVTNIPFDFSPHPGSRRRPWAPSIDRIDSSKGYTFENCRLVCTAVNVAMQDWGVEVLLKIAKALQHPNEH